MAASAEMCLKRRRPGAGLNHRHHGFQPCALPTELPGRRYVVLIAWCGRVQGGLFISVGDAAFGEIVGSHFNEDFVASEDTDSIFTHFACDMGGNLVIIFEFHAEHGVGQQFSDDAGHFDEFFFGHLLIRFEGGLFHIHNTDEGKESPCSVGVGFDGSAGFFFTEALQEQLSAFIVELSACLVELLDAFEGGGFDGVVVAFADEEIVAHDASERRERETYFCAVLDGEDEASLLARQAEMIGAALFRVMEVIIFEQIEQGGFAFMVEFFAAWSREAFAESEFNDSIGVIGFSRGSFCGARARGVGVVECHEGVFFLSRMAAAKAWAWRPSASASAMAASAR